MRPFPRRVRRPRVVWPRRIRRPWMWWDRRPRPMRPRASCCPRPAQRQGRREAPGALTQQRTRNLRGSKGLRPSDSEGERWRAPGVGPGPCRFVCLSETLWRARYPTLGEVRSGGAGAARRARRAGSARARRGRPTTKDGCGSDSGDDGFVSHAHSCGWSLCVHRKPSLPPAFGPRIASHWR